MITAPSFLIFNAFVLQWNWWLATLIAVILWNVEPYLWALPMAFKKRE